MKIKTPHLEPTAQIQNANIGCKSRELRSRMKKPLELALGLLFVHTALSSHAAYAKPRTIEFTQRSAESQVRRLLEPLLDKYCHDECKLMSVIVSVDIAVPDEIAPGFDEIEMNKSGELAPSSARVKILMADKVGPVSRRKLLDLVQQYLDTLEYPVKIDTQIAHFPQPQGSEGKVAQLRERISKQFTSTVDELLKQFCPQQCMLADFDLHTDVVNGEEAEYGATGEFIQDGDTAIRIRDLAATILMDDSLSPQEQANILEMAKLKTNSFKHVNLEGKSLRFPRPGSSELGPNGEYLSYGGVSPRGLASEKSKSESKLNSESKYNSDSKHNSDSKTNQESKFNSKSNSDSKSINDSRSNTNSNSNSKTNSEQNSNSTNTNNNLEQNSHNEKYERYEKIERVENGDAVQAELQKFKVYGLIFTCSILTLLIFIAVAGFRQQLSSTSTLRQALQDLAITPPAYAPPTTRDETKTLEMTRENVSNNNNNNTFSKRYEIERLTEELTSVYAQQPKVAKQVFSRVLSEEGVEITAACIHIFGEGIVVDMLRDPSLQTDVAELMEFYAKNPIDIDDDDRLSLLRKLQNRTVAGKLIVLGNRSSNLFDFLGEMDGLQILELIRTETLTVKSIILTQCDPQKRSAIYSQLDAETRMKLLTELSRIDYLPRDFIFNVSAALKRKKKDNPKLNTEALPGSDVLVSLLERTGQEMQRTVMKNLEVTNPNSARTVKGKLVSIDTLKFLRDGQLLEVVLNLKHDELIQFLKGAPNEVRRTIFSKAPNELVLELEEELEHAGVISRETYQSLERKIINRMKIMSNEGQINLVETNERMFGNDSIDVPFVDSMPAPSPEGSSQEAAG